MAITSTRVCDRCGKELRFIGWTAFIKNVRKKGRTIKILKLFNGNPDGYSYSEGQYEMCAECTKKLKDFLKGNELKGVEQ